MPAKLTPARIAEIREMDAAASAGPWRYYDRKYPVGPAIAGALGPVVATWFPLDVPRSDAEHETNAKLIAALRSDATPLLAAELLMEAKEFVRHAEDCGALERCDDCANPHYGRCDCGLSALLAKIEAVVS